MSTGQQWKTTTSEKDTYHPGKIGGESHNSDSTVNEQENLAQNLVGYLDKIRAPDIQPLREDPI